MMMEDEWEKIKKREKDLTEYLREQHPECFKEQRHTDKGTQERVYWHYGYLIAIRDILALFNGPDTPNG